VEKLTQLPLVASGKMRRMSEERLFAVRGAAQAEANEADAILAATTELMKELLERNRLAAPAIVSCLFTTTADLDAEFPAVAARHLGLDQVPLLCCSEIPVPGSMERVIRVLVHFYAPSSHTPAHCYLGKTKELRSDLHAAQ
jgi:chorismate mutase